MTAATLLSSCSAAVLQRGRLSTTRRCNPVSCMFVCLLNRPITVLLLCMQMQLLQHIHASCIMHHAMNECHDAMRYNSAAALSDSVTKPSMKACNQLRAMELMLQAFAICRKQVTHEQHVFHKLRHCMLAKSMSCLSRSHAC